MARFIVDKQKNGKIQPWNYSQDRNDDRIVRLRPGVDFLYIDADNEQQATKQAEAYWNGTYADPQEIDTWVERAQTRKAYAESLIDVQWQIDVPPENDPEVLVGKFDAPSGTIRLLCWPGEQNRPSNASGWRTWTGGP